ncbi:hypothetical protein GQ53DRAFT_870288, partial [Thozetella sp. PMI_491]
MSGLEPLAVFGIACNVMQTIDFGREVISSFRQLYQDGSVDPGLATTAADLRSTAQTLEKSLNSAHKPVTAEESELLNLAGRCMTVSAKLSSSLEKLSSPVSKTEGKLSRVMATVRLTPKRLWEKGNLERQEKELKRAQDTLETCLLVRVCSQGMERTLYNFIQQCSRGHTTLEALIKANSDALRDHAIQESKTIQNIIAKQHHDTRELIQLEQGETRDRISRELREAATIQDLEMKRTKILASLDFHSRNERVNGIAEAHTQTFDWLFGISEGEGDESGTEQDHDCVLLGFEKDAKKATWDSFSLWLASDEPIYWISGKPGAGKSTLMKHLYSHPQTKQRLSRRTNETVLLLSHFFYLMGNPMQHNINGLLSNLLYQLLDEDPDRKLINQLFEQFPNSLKKRFETDWSRRELQDALIHLLASASEKHQVCTFLDGLDEIDAKDGPYELLQVLREMQACAPRAKMAISSRQEQAFHSAFSSMPHLRLHLLTSPGMYKYALELFASTVHPFPEDLPCHETLAKRVVEKSEGVFLWTHLAVRSLERGFANEDDRKTIHIRLEEMPSGLELLYASMWKRLNADTKAYRAEAALLFKLVL